MTDVTVRTIPTTVHGRYLVRDGPPERLLVGFHGYGETAEAHMAELEQIPASIAGPPWPSRRCILFM